MAVRGDYAKIAKVRLGIERAGGRVAVLTRVVGEAALEALRDGFDRGRAPDGAAWARTTDGRRPLGGSLAASWALRVSGTVASLRSDHVGARLHQRGGVVVAKRGGAGRDAAGRFARGRLGVLAFTVGGRKVFARKVTIPQRRMHPAAGTLEGWAEPIAARVRAHFAGVL